MNTQDGSGSGAKKSEGWSESHCLNHDITMRFPFSVQAPKTSAHHREYFQGARAALCVDRCGLEQMYEKPIQPKDFFSIEVDYARQPPYLKGKVPMHFRTLRSEQPEGREFK